MLRQLAPFATDLWAHRELLWQFTLRNVELRHKGSHLGLIWSFLNPLLMLGLYVLVFGFVFGGGFHVSPNETKIDYGLGIFIGLSLYHFLAEVIGNSPTVILGNPNFVKKVVFPLEILPAAGTASAFFHLLISLSLALLGVTLVGPGPSWGMLWLPVILLPLVLLSLGVAWLISSLGVFFRDLGQIIQFVTVVLMWASGVFFTAAKHPSAWVWLRFNPLLLAIDLARDAVLWNRALNFNHLLYIYLCGLAACSAGYFLFRRFKPAFADVI